MRERRVLLCEFHSGAAHPDIDKIWRCHVRNNSSTLMPQGGIWNSYPGADYGPDRRCFSPGARQPARYADRQLRDRVRLAADPQQWQCLYGRQRDRVHARRGTLQPLPGGGSGKADRPRGEWHTAHPGGRLPADGSLPQPGRRQRPGCLVRWTQDRLCRAGGRLLRYLSPDQPRRLAHLYHQRRWDRTQAGHLLRPRQPGPVTIPRDSGPIQEI
jgi:hypothetical protein